jgi:hypothetical protein
VFGGLYIVPLYALIQERSAPSHRSRIIAANNILNALFIVAAALCAIALLKAGLSIPDLFLVTGLMNAAVALFIYRLVPEFLMRFLAWILVNLVYRVRVTGLENVPDEGPLRHRVQPRELRRRGRDRRVRAPAGAVRDGPPDLHDAGARLAVPHDGGDPDRAGPRGRDAQAARVRGGRGRARARRGARDLPGGPLTPDGELGDFRPA